MEVIHAPAAPPAIGPYSHAAQSATFVFASGQLGVDPATGQLPEGIADQTRQALANLDAVAAAAGVSRNKVIKTTLFLTSMSHFSLVNEIYAEFFGDHKPARSTVAVNELPKGALFEIEAIFEKNSGTL